MFAVTDAATLAELLCIVGWETLRVALLLPFMAELAVPSLLLFGAAAQPGTLAVAVAAGLGGTLAGMAVNATVGRLLRRASATSATFQRVLAQETRLRWATALLLLTLMWHPLAPLAAVVAGFVRLDWRVLAVVVVAGKLAQYAYLFLTVTG